MDAWLLIFFSAHFSVIDLLDLSDLSDLSTSESGLVLAADLLLLVLCGSVTGRGLRRKHFEFLCFSIWMLEAIPNFATVTKSKFSYVDGDVSSMMWSSLEQNFGLRYVSCQKLFSSSQGTIFSLYGDFLKGSISLFPDEAPEQSIDLFVSKAVDVEEAEGVLVSPRKLRIQAHLIKGERDHTVNTTGKSVDVNQQKKDVDSKLSSVKKRKNPAAEDMDDFVTPLAKKSNPKAFKVPTRSSPRFVSKFKLPPRLVVESNPPQENLIPSPTKDADVGDIHLTPADIGQNNQETPKVGMNIPSTDCSDDAHNQFMPGENSDTFGNVKDSAIPDWASLLFTKLSFVELSLNSIEDRLDDLEQRPSQVQISTCFADIEKRLTVLENHRTVSQPVDAANNIEKRVASLESSSIASHLADSIIKIFERLAALEICTNQAPSTAVLNEPKKDADISPYPHVSEAMKQKEAILLNESVKDIVLHISNSSDHYSADDVGDVPKAPPPISDEANLCPKVVLRRSHKATKAGASTVTPFTVQKGKKKEQD